MTTPNFEHKRTKLREPCTSRLLLYFTKQFSFESHTNHKLFIYFNNMKLHLLLLASLCNLSSGIMVELKGKLAEEACTGEEYADFKYCVKQSSALDPFLTQWTDFEDEAFVHRDHGDERQLGWCDGCPYGAPRGTFCFTVCGGGRRRLEEATDKPNLRRVQELTQEYKRAEFEGGNYTGNGDAKQIAREIIECLAEDSTHHPCLGSADKMKLKVTL
jgi:hypothetical protein